MTRPLSPRGLGAKVNSPVSPPARIGSLRVTFANGESEDIRVPRELSGGQESAPIELRGREHFIEQIELHYTTKLNFKGDAIVEVYGLK